MSVMMRFLWFYRWILGISPSGSSNLLSALKTVFESGSILEEDEENGDDNVIQLVEHGRIVTTMLYLSIDVLY